jgi:hypothetical protein
MFKGDTGLFRAALLLSGFFARSECMIFNDKNTTGGRRLKLWFADAVEQAPLEQQQVLWEHLLEAFGDRIKDVKFLDNFGYPMFGDPGYSLAIYLRD